jgi:hypothetical protein
MAKRTGGFIGQDGINAPDPATGVTGTAGSGQVEVSFTAPSDVGGAAITGYQVQSNNGDGTYVSTYDLSSASYDGVSFGVASQETAPYGLTFNNDGTKLYVTGQGTDTVYQYSLSTAFDLDTTSYDSVSFNANSQNTAIAGVAFNNDGTKMYLVGYNSPSSVFQYSLSTAFDLSTASYDSVSFNVSSQASTAFGLAFNNNGTKMYIVSFGNDTIYQYSLSSAFNLSTASYDSVSLSVNAQEAAPAGMTFNNDGTKMYIVGENGDEVNQYGLSTAFDLSTASYDNIAFSVSGQDIQPADIAFSNDGTKMFMVGYNTDAVYQYSTGIAVGDYPTSSPVTITGLTNGTSYTFNVWAINPFGWSSPSDASASFTPVATMVAFMGGYSGATVYNVIDFFDVNTTGNATDWGNLGTSRGGGGAASNATRGLVGGGGTPSSSSSITARIDYITWASTGNSLNFGNLTVARYYKVGGVSNDTRGVFVTGRNSSFQGSNVMDYVTLASTGNATDFGNYGLYLRDGPAGCSSPTRGVLAGGADQNSTKYNVIQYITIASTGNSTDFGDLTSTSQDDGNGSSSTRGLFTGTGSSTNNSGINYITIASTGNATNFGSLTVSKRYHEGNSSKSRALTASANYAEAVTVDYVEISSTGNATDFGDLTVNRNGSTGVANSHGGLS